MERKPACPQTPNTASDLIESFASIFNEQLVCLMWWLHGYEFVPYLGHTASNAVIFNFYLSRNYAKQAAEIEKTMIYSWSNRLQSSTGPVYLGDVPIAAVWSPQELTDCFSTASCLLHSWAVAVTSRVAGEQHHTVDVNYWRITIISSTATV